jgi:hypothetical protein
MILFLTQPLIDDQEISLLRLMFVESEYKKLIKENSTLKKLNASLSEQINQLKIK